MYYELFENVDWKVEGVETAVEFFHEICEKTVYFCKRYYDNLEKDLSENEEHLKEHGFLYKEQQVKSYLTAALNEVTDSYFMQEHPIERFKGATEAIRDEEEFKKGRLDYWANFKDSSFLIEVKHRWIRYYPIRDYPNRDGGFTVYKSVEYGMHSAVKQLHYIEGKSGFKFKDHIFTIALIVTPIYVRGKNVHQKPIRLNPDLGDELIKKLTNKKGRYCPNIIGRWNIEKEYLFDIPFDDDFVEYYPMVCFVGKIKKVSKTL